MIKHKIALVEDDFIQANLIAGELIRSGFDVVKALDGRQGLDLILRERPDLIVLDIIMPVMDGITMLKELRKDEWGEKAKVIVLTNLNDQNKIVEALENQTFDYLVKTDWSLEDLVKRIKSRLEE